MLHGINGKLDNAEEKASKSKTIMTETAWMKHKRKMRGERHHQCAGTSGVTKSSWRGREQNTFEEVIAEYFQKFMKTIKQHPRDTQKIPSYE